MMKDESSSGNPKMDDFLEAVLDDGYSNYFKSLSNNKVVHSLESLQIACDRTPIMSPIGPKYSIDKSSNQENTEIKQVKREFKFTPLKDITSHINQNVSNHISNYNSADKAKKRNMNIAKEHIDEGIKIINHNKENIDYKLTKCSQSAKKLRKFESKIKKEYKTKEVMHERSPLIPKYKVGGDLLSVESSELEHHIISDSDPVSRSSRDHRSFLPRKVLDFEEKDADYKGRNLFDEDNYQ
jgi:hypothetical protein